MITEHEAELYREVNRLRAENRRLGAKLAMTESAGDELFINLKAADKEISELKAKLNTEMAEHTREVLLHSVTKAKLAEAETNTHWLRSELAVHKDKLVQMESLFKEAQSDCKHLTLDLEAGRPQPSREQVRELLLQIDEMARDCDSYDYGLPRHNTEQFHKLIDHVMHWLQSLTSSGREEGET